MISVAAPAPPSRPLAPPARFGALSAHWDGVLLHALVGLAVTFTLLFGSPALTLAVGGALCLPTYAYLGVREAKRSTVWFTPLSFYFLWYTIGFGFAALYMGYFVSTGDWPQLAGTWVSPQDTAVGYVIYLWGSIALHAGIQAFRPGRPAEAPAKPRKVSLGWLVVLWAVGLASIWEPDLILALGAPGRIIQWGGFAALSTFALTPRRKLGLSSMGYALIFAVGTGGLFAVNMMAYSKAFIMFSFMPLVWFFMLRPKIRKWLPAIGVVLASFYLLVLAPVMTVARFTPLRPGESYASRLVDTFERFVDSGGVAVEGLSVGDYAEGLMQRQFDALPLSFFVEQVRNGGLQNGATMEHAAYALIPRVLWANKPNVTRGNWFAYYVGFAESEETATMTLGFTAAGELYWNFGVPGVLVGMLAIGALFGRLWRIAGADPRGDPIRMLLYVMVMMNMGNMAEAVTVFTFIVAAFVTFGFALGVRQLLHLSTRRINVNGSVASRAGYAGVLPDHRWS